MAIGLSLKSVITAGMAALVFFLILPYLIDNVTGLTLTGFTGPSAVIAPFILVAFIVGVILYILNLFGHGN